MSEAFGGIYRVEVYRSDNYRYDPELCLSVPGHQGAALGTSYAIWTGIGALGAVIVGILYFKGTGYGGEIDLCLPGF